MWEYATLCGLGNGTEVGSFLVSAGQSAELILIGYDGIAHPPLLFPHQPSFFMFLECLENSLLPQGCLEPPLWYIKDKTNKVGVANQSHSHNVFENNVAGLQ